MYLIPLQRLLCAIYHLDMNSGIRLLRSTGVILANITLCHLIYMINGVWPPVVQS